MSLLHNFCIFKALRRIVDDKKEPPRRGFGSREEEM
jgi:hypothetical protein